MTNDDSAVFVARLTLLAELLGEPMTPTRLAGYVGACDDLDLADLAAALNDCARTCQFFPRPVEIRERVTAAQDRRIQITQASRPALAVPARETTPAPTPEEAAAHAIRYREAYAAFRAKWREVAGLKTMDGSPSQTLVQIEEWRRTGGER